MYTFPHTAKLAVSVMLFSFAYAPSVFAQEGATTSIDVNVSTTTQQQGVVSTTPDDGEENGEEGIHQVPIVEKIFAPVYKTRWFRRIERVFSFKDTAAHHCDAAVYSVDVTGKTSVTAVLALASATGSSGEVEIGAAPDGFDIVFQSTNTHDFRSRSGNDVVDLLILKRDWAQKGSFNIPIAYTERTGEKASVVCQINLLNR